MKNLIVLIATLGAMMPVAFAAKNKKILDNLWKESGRVAEIQDFKDIDRCYKVSLTSDSIYQATVKYERRVLNGGSVFGGKEVDVFRFGGPVINATFSSDSSKISTNSKTLSGLYEYEISHYEQIKSKFRSRYHYGKDILLFYADNIHERHDPFATTGNFYKADYFYGFCDLKN
ncbi:hypothetical protein N9O57_02330 [bacterium]|nr:hypothetical protein [bacterium]